MKQEVKYEEALPQLETIVRKMENDELDIDQMTEQLKRAQQLIKLCKDKLTKTDEEIKKILARANNNAEKFVRFANYLLFYSLRSIGQKVAKTHQQ